MMDSIEFIGVGLSLAMFIVMCTAFILDSRPPAEYKLLGIAATVSAYPEVNKMCMSVAEVLFG